MNNLKKFSALVTTTLLLTVGLAAPSNAASTSVKPTADIPTDTAISAVSTASLKFDRPVVQTSPAPIVAAPVEVQEAPVAQIATQTTPAVKTATASAPIASNTTPTPTKTVAPTATPTAVPASGKGAAILSAAMGQLGIRQDCTMLVTNSLAAAGIHFHDWPAGYLSLGSVVPASQAQPGDLIYYANGGGGMAHIAVYAGNGQAVHGGFNGDQTIVFSANVGSGPVFIRVA